MCNGGSVERYARDSTSANRPSVSAESAFVVNRPPSDQTDRPAPAWRRNGARLPGWTVMPGVSRRRVEKSPGKLAHMSTRGFPSSLLVAVGLLAGFGIAQGTGVRALGGA